jgi:hypothetical protein
LLRKSTVVEAPASLPNLLGHENDEAAPRYAELSQSDITDAKECGEVRSIPRSASCVKGAKRRSEPLTEASTEEPSHEGAADSAGCFHCAGFTRFSTAGNNTMR